MVRDGLDIRVGRPAVVVYGHDDAVSRWVAARLGFPAWSSCVAIGVARGDALIGGVVYHDYRREDGDIEMICAATDRRWLTRSNLFTFFAYPFLQLGCGRVSCVSYKRNRHARKFIEKLGWRLEGVHRKALRGHDVVSYGMLKNECRWIAHG